MKITLIGAGSASFGLNTLSALMRSEKLRGTEIAMVDRNAEALSRMGRLTQRLNREWDAEMQITTFAHHQEALPGTDFVISAIEVPPREKLWRQDYEITLTYGVRQPYAENGGPGGLFHAARNIGPVLEIAHDMEKTCPNAWYVNFTNPMTRICDAIHHHSQIKVIGLCHQIYAGYGMVGYVLADYLGIQLPDGPFSTHADPDYWVNLGIIAHQAEQVVDIKAAGLNHFTWIVDIRDKRTGTDLYPLLREAWEKADPSIEPLTRRVFQAFGLMPVPGDEHLCEYLPWVSNPVTKPWEKYDLSLYDWDKMERGRTDDHTRIDQLAEGMLDLQSLREANSEGALEVVEALSFAGNQYLLAMNLPNTGQISNLPFGAIVETPGLLTGMGAQPLAVGSLPEGVAELCRRELTCIRLGVDAAVFGDRQKALQCLLLDPFITDLDIARQILDDYLNTYRQYLPTFWK